MSVEFATPDLLPYVCAEYVCPACGGIHVQHGSQAGEPPAGWVIVRTGAAPDYACPGCAPRTVNAG